MVLYKGKKNLSCSAILIYLFYPGVGISIIFLNVGAYRVSSSSFSSEYNTILFYHTIDLAAAWSLLENILRTTLLNSLKR